MGKSKRAREEGGQAKAKESRHKKKDDSGDESGHSSGSEVGTVTYATRRALHVCVTMF